MKSHTKYDYHDIVLFFLSLLFVFFAFVLKGHGILSIYYGIFLLGVTPSFGILSAFIDNKKNNKISVILIHLMITSQIIVVLFPLLLFLITFLYTNTRETPIFFVTAAYIVSITSICFIAISMILNFIYVAIIRRSACFSFIGQIVCVITGFFTMFYGESIGL